MATSEQRLDRIERVLAAAIALGDKRLDRVEQKLELLADAQLKTGETILRAQLKTDETINRLAEVVRNLTAVVDSYFAGLERKGSNGDQESNHHGKAQT